MARPVRGQKDFIHTLTHMYIYIFFRKKSLKYNIIILHIPHVIIICDTTVSDARVTEEKKMIELSLVFLFCFIF